MFRVNTRVRSFTLVELLVVILLTSIMIGILYSAFYSVFTYRANLELKQQMSEDMSALYFRLKVDFEKSRKIQSNNAMWISCILDGDEHVDYMFDSLYVVRSQLNRVDTFQCAALSAVSQFEGRQVRAYPGVIDALVVTLMSASRKLDIRVAKHYDVASLISLSRNDSIQ